MYDYPYYDYPRYRPLGAWDYYRGFDRGFGGRGGGEDGRGHAADMQSRAQRMLQDAIRETERGDTSRSDALTLNAIRLLEQAREFLKW